MKSIESFLDKVCLELGLTPTSEALTYLSSKGNLTSEQVASLILLDEDLDIVMNFDLKVQIKKLFYDYYGEESISFE